MNPAVWEVSGHMVLKRKEDYEGASEENAWRLLAEVSLSEERFQEVKALIFEAITCGDDDDKGNVSDYKVEEADGTPPSHEDAGAISNSSFPAAMVSGKQECLVQQ